MKVIDLLTFLKNKNKIDKKYRIIKGSLVDILGLTQFWYDNLNNEEKDFLLNLFNEPDSNNDIKDVYTNNYIAGFNKNTKSGLLITWGNYCFYKINYYLAEKLFSQAECFSYNVVELQFMYNNLIDVYYKFRDESNYLQNCIDTCIKDIQITDKFLNELRKNDLELRDELYLDNPNLKNLEKDFKLPRIPSFQRLAIIYENQGEYDKAIDICEKAIMFNLEDGTKMGFKGRIEKLTKKKVKQNRS